MAKVLLKDIRKTYPDGLEAVHGISLEIRDGEFMVLVGPSGCSKSTILRMIAGLEDITGGDIIIGERRVNNLSPADRNVAMVFQDYALYPHMSVFNNMAYGLKTRGFPRNEIKKRVERAADILGLEGELNKKPKALSGGQRQRVAVGRVIVRQPQVFLFDEPLSNLDAKLRVHMRAEIIKIQKELGTTMIYVTHDQVEAMTMGERICVMNEGEIMQVDEPLKIYDKPANRFVATFIGSPSMNIIRGEIVSRGKPLFFESKGFNLELPEEKRDLLRLYENKEIEMGIRPEHISFSDFSSKENNLVTGEVFIIELMGNEKIIHFHAGGKTLVCRTGPHCKLEKGKKASFKFNTHFCHFFDVFTKENIIPRLQG
ncbi:MAG: ABC transporter ATP-binding protein [bacterium]